jgi:ADP-heptose:LPS heptosyltransferase
MIHFVCTMAYGDSLITLSQLEHCQERNDWRIIGTAVTRKVAALLTHPLAVTEILPDKAAFNSIKEYGLLAAARDFLHVRNALRQLSSTGDTLAFERYDVRNALLVPRGRCAAYAPRAEGAYSDRRRLIENLLGRSQAWRLTSKPGTPLQRVVINPCARYRHRWLSSAIMQNVIRLCAERGWELTVVDPSGEYQDIARRVNDYVSRPLLSTAAGILRHSDLYIGPDSFFLHLAYYYGVPHFGFFYPDNLYFMTPGMRAISSWMTFEMAQDYIPFADAVDKYLEGEQTQMKDFLASTP